MSVALALAIPETEDIRVNWDHVRANFAADELFIIGKGFLGCAAQLPIQPLVLLQPQRGVVYRGAVSLEDFRHPVDATYLFGPDKTWVTADYMGGREPDHIVYIPTSTHRDMFSYVTWAVVAWDRKMKL